MSRRKARAPRPTDPDTFWSSAKPEAIIKRLGSRSLLLDSSIARAIRDRAAAFLLTDPSRAAALASALFAAVRRRAAGPDAQTRAIAWRCRAEADLFTGRLRSARRAYEHATAEAEAARLHELLGQLLVGRVHVLSVMGAGAEAALLADRAERLLRKTGDLTYLGKLHMNRGNAFYQKDQYHEAYEAYRKAAQVFQRAGVRDATWVGLLMNQAIACTNLSRVEEARKIFMRTEKHCERLDLESLGAHAGYNRAFLEALRGDYRQALSLLERAGATFERQGVLDMTAATQRARAEIYLELGMPEEASGLARAAAEAFSRQDMVLDAVLSHVHEARGLLLSGKAEEAIPILMEADRFYKHRGIRPHRAATLLHQARCAFLLGENARSAALARRAHGIFKRLGMLKARSEAGRMMAETWLARGRPKKAEQLLGPALAESRVQPTGERLELWALAGQISRARGRRREAARRLRRAVAYLEAQRRLIPGTELRARAFEDRVRVYHDLISLALETPTPRFSTLFRLAEAARARGFRDRMSHAGASARHMVIAKRAKLGSMVRRLEQAEFPEKGTPNPTTLGQLRAQVHALEKEIGDQIRRAEGTHPGAPAWHGAASPASTARLLRRDEALIEYFVVGEKVLAFVLRPRRQIFRVLPVGTKILQGLLERVCFQIGAMTLSLERPRGDPAFLRRATEVALRDLHTALLAPLNDVLPPKGRLIFVPHRSLHRVPFECLYDGSGYLCDRYVISRCPAADFLLRRTSRSRRRRRLVLICGTIQSGPAAVAAELETVASFFSSDETRILRDAPTAEILSAMRGCRVLHLSAHGVFREDNPLFSRLSTGDGALFLADMLGGHLSAELVVLSACNSGQVFTGQGDDLSGVAHGFLAAGARQLVASLWRVHDKATRTLMEGFYRHYTTDAKKDPARALAEAGRDMREEWNHPFYWGSFSVHGA